MACQSVFHWESGAKTPKMLWKIAPKPCIYWLSLAFSFFLFGACKSTGTPTLTSPSSGFSGLVLYTKSIRKWNPRFFEEGSAYHSFVEVSGGQEPKKIWRTDISLSIRDMDFLKSVQTFFPKTSMKRYHLHYYRQEGILKKTTNSDTVEAVFQSYSQGESDSNDLVTLLKQLNTSNTNRISISESAVFQPGSNSDEFTLGSETIRLDNGSSLTWTYEYGALGSATPNGEFKSSSDLVFQSTSYDASKIQFEKIPMEPEKFFFKSLWKTDKQEIFFVPALANSPRFLSTEPIEYKRFGNFLIKEESL